MNKNSQPNFYYILNGVSLIFPLYAVGSTLRLMLISVTLILWLHAQWLGYASILKERRSARLAAAADEIRMLRRKEIADITESVGKNLILLLDEERERILNLNQEVKRRQEIEQATINESNRVKDQQLKIREENILIRERKVEESDEALRLLQKGLEQREQNLKIAEDSAREIHQRQEELRRQSHQVFQQTPAFSPVPPPLFNISLPSDLLEYSNDLKSFFTCIGVTQKGTRCRQSMISNADKLAAADRIAKMTSPSPGDTFEMHALRELADWMLCPRWHRDKLPQGDTIARRWYAQLSAARAKIQRQTQTYMNPVTPMMTPPPAFTPPSSLPSAGVPSVFSSYSAGTPSSIASVQSSPIPYTGSGYQFMGCQGMSPQAFMNPPNPMAAAPGNFPAQNLTPLFQAVAQQPR